MTESRRVERALGRSRSVVGATCLFTLLCILQGRWHSPSAQLFITFIGGYHGYTFRPLSVYIQAIKMRKIKIRIAIFFFSMWVELRC